MNLKYAVFYSVSSGRKVSDIKYNNLKVSTNQVSEIGVSY